MRTRQSLLYLLTLMLCCSSLHPTVATAQSFCSAEDVQLALEELDCEPDGSYISAQAAADLVAERCADKPTEQACRACFRRTSARIMTAFKALTRSGLLDRKTAGELRNALADARDEVCSFDLPDEPTEPPKTDPLPEPTPEPIPTAPPFLEPPAMPEPPTEPSFFSPRWPFNQKHRK
jgi:hypothetical protein